MSINWWINKLWYFHMMEYYSTYKINEMLKQAIMWMILENIVLSGRSQTPKATYLWFHFYERLRICKSMEQKGNLVVTTHWDMWGKGVTDGVRGSFGLLSVLGLLIYIGTIFSDYVLHLSLYIELFSSLGVWFPFFASFSSFIFFGCYPIGYCVTSNFVFLSEMLFFSFDIGFWLRSVGLFVFPVFQSFLHFSNSIIYKY